MYKLFQQSERDEALKEQLQEELEDKAHSQLPNIKTGYFTLVFSDAILPFPSLASAEAEETPQKWVGVVGGGLTRTMVSQNIHSAGSYSCEEQGRGC